MARRLRRRLYCSPLTPPSAGNRCRRWVTPLALFVTLLSASTLLPKRLVVLNLSPSLPLGFYCAVSVEPAAGRLVEFRLSAQPVDGERFARHRVILKPILAGPGEHVDTTGDLLWVNEKLVAPIYTKDSNGHPLPVWRANRALEPDEFFVFSARVPNSFDSRYYGPIRRSDILAVYVPLWTLGEPVEQDDASRPTASSRTEP